MFTKSDKCDIIFLLYMTRGDCMIKKEMIAMLLAGGQGSRLGVLTEKVAKPAVAFGGKYRIIDFPLSNCINSGIDTVGVLTQYQPLWAVLPCFPPTKKMVTATGIPEQQTQFFRIWHTWRPIIRTTF